MGLRIYSLRLALSAALLIALTAIPGVWNSQSPGIAFGPATAWAGGTPDETLNPPPIPPKKASAFYQRWEKTPTVADQSILSRTDRRNSFSKFDRLLAVWTFVRATTLRM